jgi:hypothetical protein
MNGRTWFPVSSGLLTAEHSQKIGAALWVFLWMIHHQYRPKDGEPDSGTVNAGEPISYSEIGFDLGIPASTIRKHIAVLITEEYVRSESVAGLGKRYFVANPIRWALGLTKNGQTSPAGLSVDGQGVRPFLDGSLTKNEHPNKEQRTQRTTKNKSVGFDPVEIPFPESLTLTRLSWGEWVEHRKQLRHSLTELTARKSLEKLVAFQKQGYSPAAVIDHCIANGWQGLFAPNVQPKPAEDTGGALKNFRKLLADAGVAAK